MAGVADPQRADVGGETGGVGEVTGEGGQRLHAAVHVEETRTRDVLAV